LKQSFTKKAMKNATISLYSPLNKSKLEIRLLHLQPRSWGEAITCSLHLADLDDEHCKYEALSYEWGDPDKTKQIILDDRSVIVRENLWWALWYLKRQGEIRVIWIDALCINQEDVIERNQQITQMGKIYRRAMMVVAWVGREEDQGEIEKSVLTEHLTSSDRSASAGLKLVNTLYGTSENERYYSIGGPYAISYKYSQTHSNAPAADLGELYCEKGWRSLTEFCFWSYWTRLWIIQELVLAQDITIQSGEFQICWAVLIHAISNAPHGTSFELHWNYQLRHLTFWQIQNQRIEFKS
jgi:hypothetical protein